ncbi:MAG: type II toxin-antitoxin system VapC family toxin [Nitrososphaerales archaeon]
MLVETDVLLAALNSSDPVNEQALKILDQAPLLSPFSLLETSLLARAGKLEISDYGDFWKDLGALLGTFSVEVLSDRTLYHSVARKFESRFKLTFFDSLHAAVSKVEGEILASFDHAYDRLKNEGVKRIDPSGP